MIVFDLKCARGHVFEIWFGSSADYESQRKRRMIACPFCGDVDVGKAVMAPAVETKSSRKAEPSAVTNGMANPERMRAMMESLAAMQRQALENSEWVGRSFADKARAMHYGEEGHKLIHGEVAPAEAKALHEEGVPVAPLPFPVVPPDAKN
jgi:hypothetical protein